MIDFLASAPHYADHLSAVRDALPPAARGEFIAPGKPDTDNPILVASYGDLKTAESMGRTKIAIMEHGAGQSYGGRGGMQHGSYAGGLNRDAASLFLHPGEHPAARDRRSYPGARVEVVGSPYLDTLPKRKGRRGRVVAFTFHFNGPLCPETRSAYPHFFPFIVGLADKYQLIGTTHPMLWDIGRPGQRIPDRYRQHGIEPVRDFREVCRRADVLVFDNTSAGFLFAATGRPVVVMNSPRYDKRVNHGLRFWEAANVGVNCDDPTRLAECIEEALADPPERKADRQAALEIVYGFRTGAAKRTADVLLDWSAA